MVASGATPQPASVPEPASNPSLQAATRIQAELDRKAKSPMTFTPAAMEALEEAAAAHLETVGLNAIARARREDLSNVDVTHVKRADEASGGNTRGTTLITVLNSVGGVVAGVGLALVVTLFNRPASRVPALSRR